MPETKQRPSNQSGLASIMVTMIIMIVISLIVLAAAQLARRGQRQSLDRQLNTQAYYAAESGVNDAVKKIDDQLKDADPSNSLIDSDRTDNCGQFITAAGLTANTTLGSNIEYTCLFVDPTPTTWEGTVTDTSRTTPIKNAAGGPVQSITIAWQSSDNSEESKIFTNCNQTLSPETGPGARACRTPVLRYDLVPTVNTDRTSLNTNVKTGYLLPVSAGSATHSFSSAPAAGTTAVTCNETYTPKYCKVTITGLGATSYHLRMKSIYGSATVTVSGSTGLTENPKFELKDAQIVIDSTGKANDVLRRIQVRVPFGGAFNIPEFAIESGHTICKRLNVSGVNNVTSVSGDAACLP